MSKIDDSVKTKSFADQEKEIQQEMRAIDKDLLSLKVRRAELEKTLNKLYKEWK